MSNTFNKNGITNYLEVHHLASATFSCHILTTSQTNQNCTHPQDKGKVIDRCRYLARLNTMDGFFKR